MVEILEKETKQIVKGFHSNSELSEWIKQMPEETREKVSKAIQINEILRYVKWGVITKEEGKERIEKI